MRWQSSYVWMLGSLLAAQGPIAFADEIPIISSQSAPLAREVQPASALGPVVVQSGQQSSRKTDVESSAGVIKLISPPRVASRPQPPKPVESVAEPPSQPKPLPSANPPSGKPVKALRSPLVVHRTARLAVEIEARESGGQQRVDVNVRNESPQPAGRTQLVITIPTPLTVVQSRPTADDRQQLADSQRFVYQLDALAATEQASVALTLDGTTDARGLIHAVVETQAEASKLLEITAPKTSTAPKPPTLSEPTVQSAPEPTVQSAPEPVTIPSPEGRKAKSPEVGELPLLVSGPKRAQAGATVVYSLSVENLSDQDLGEIQIKTKLPAEIYLEGQTELKLTSSLPSGMQRSMDVAVRARESGEFKVEFQAFHEGQLIAEQTVNLEVVASDLKAGIGGPQSWSVNKEATFVIDLACQGTEPIKDVVVTLQLPENIRVTTVEHEAGYDAERRLMAWRIVELQPGTSVKLHYKALGLKPGEAVQGLLVKTPDLKAPLKTSLTSEVRGSVGIKLNQNFLKR